MLLLFFKQSQFIAFALYYKVYWFINSVNNIQMKDSPAYDTVPKTQLVTV